MYETGNRVKFTKFKIGTPYQVNSQLQPQQGNSRMEECALEYWTINGDRFENYIRDQIMVDDAAEHCGQLASHVLRNTLRISEHG